MDQERAENGHLGGKVLDAVIIGAGLSGMYQLYRLRNLGLNVRVLEAGSGVGGTWYWNRYPGARFDSESYSYGYSFSPEILAKWNWKEHFAGQPEIEAYCNFVADELDLRKNIQFHTKVTSAKFCAESHYWDIETDGQGHFQARYLVTAIGALSATTFPRFEGINSFEGFSCHTSTWPKSGVDLAGKRVAVVGTGASGVQTIQEVAKVCSSLTVFQRRPNWCTPLNNGPIDREEMEDIRARYREIFERCQQTAASFIHTIDPRGTFEVDEKTRNEFWESLYAGRGFGIWQGNFRDILTDPEANRLISEFVANKIRNRVHDPKIAEMLIPKDHGFGTRRVPQETGYYEVYNKPHVSLVSMLDDPIERVTPKGIKTASHSYDFDVIIYATGFDAVTGSFDRIDLRGEGGIALRDVWQDGPKTFLGIMVEKFPNFFMILGPHSVLGNNPRSIEYGVEWVSDLIAFMENHHHKTVMADKSSADQWYEFVASKAEGLLANEVDSWMTGINLNVEGKQTRKLVRYSGSAQEYRDRCHQVAHQNYDELVFQ